jgi:hypothetical protein
MEKGSDDFYGTKTEALRTIEIENANHFRIK